MASREENIKKINAELGKLSDEELEKVVGGFYARYNVGDVNSSNPADPNQSRIINDKIIHVR